MLMDSATLYNQAENSAAGADSQTGWPERERKGTVMNANTPLRICCLAFCLWYAGPTVGAETVDAVRIVEEADRIRFPAQGFQVDARVISITDGARSVHQYRILSQNPDNTIVMTTAPASERGQTMLVKGQDLWVFMPNVSQAVRLPLSQRLTGQVANGDLARANFAGDYEPRILRKETLDGEVCQVLQLDAVDKWVTYRKVIYWVDAKDGRPHKAEFYAVSGRLLKTAHYRDFQALGDAVRPTRIVVEDALKKGHRSELVYSNMAARDLPDRVFTKDYLKKLSR